MIQGHRDGHGYVVRDDGETDLYLPPNEMRAVLHKDRVRARIVRSPVIATASGRHRAISARAHSTARVSSRPKWMSEM